ncbi:MAG: hypothetical protein AAFW70_23275, partial [Cyanobacteria bacterium J06635_10]
DELKALSESTLSPKTQVELNDLLTRNNDKTLSVEEKVHLNNLLAQVDQLNILKTRARYTLKIKGITKVAFWFIFLLTCNAKFAQNLLIVVLTVVLLNSSP